MRGSPHLAVLPASGVLHTGNANELTLAVGSVLGPIALVNVAVGERHVALGVSLSVLPAAGVLSAGRVDHRASTIYTCMSISRLAQSRPLTIKLICDGADVLCTSSRQSPS